MNKHDEELIEDYVKDRRDEVVSFWDGRFRRFVSDPPRMEEIE